MSVSKVQVSILVTLVSMMALPARAQSGRASFSGWVAFDGVAYVDKQPTAAIQVFRPDDRAHPVLSLQTDEHGHYNFSSPGLGEFLLRISAPGYVTCEIPIYMPSDFSGNLATLLKKAGEKPATAPTATAPATAPK